MRTVALDIETMADETAKLPPVDVKLGNIKDKAKIAAKVAAAEAKQREKMALDPTTGTIVCIGMVDDTGWESAFVVHGEQTERRAIEHCLPLITDYRTRLLTWNGMEFDVPYIYKRALMLGITPPIPLPDLTRRYQTTRHVDLMQVWCGWRGFAGLNAVAGALLGQWKKEIDFKQFPRLLKTEAGRAKIGEYCLHDTRLVLGLHGKMSGVLYENEPN